MTIKEVNILIGEFLKNKRIALGLTQSEVNERLHKKRTWISDIERGKSRIILDDAIELCRLYGMDIIEIQEYIKTNKK